MHQIAYNFRAKLVIKNIKLKERLKNLKTSRDSYLFIQAKNAFKNLVCKDLEQVINKLMVFIARTVMTVQSGYSTVCQYVNILIQNISRSLPSFIFCISTGGFPKADALLGAGRVWEYSIIELFFVDFSNPPPLALSIPPSHP
jgi:hypothetical protein